MKKLTLLVVVLLAAALTVACGVVPPCNLATDPAPCVPPAGDVGLPPAPG